MQLLALVDELSSQGLAPSLHAEVAEPLVELTDAAHDSRAVGNGFVFCAVPGARVDGHDFIDQAVRSGAAALLVERRIEVSVPQIVVKHVRAAMPHVAAALHSHPSRDIAVYGITGTNGKTTTTQLLSAILTANGQSVEVIGTLSGTHTTPESTEWQRSLRAAVTAGVDVVAAEVSSHALAQHRVDATTFAVAAFSNLTPDHLDYHGDMASYFAAKEQLFDGRAVHELINTDDTYGAQLAGRREHAQHITLDNVEIVDMNLAATTFVWRNRQVRLPLAGRMNVANALMAAEAARLLNVDDAGVVAGLEQVGAIPGRMQVVDPDADVTVIVDYSHTPDSIDRALAAIRATAPAATIWIVVGCGGDRDRAKRPLMGRAAEAADRVIITSDNPRTEDPMAIIEACVAGMEHPAAALIEADRRAAIELAVTSAASGDVVLVAGKGHEQTQTIGTEQLPFDDVLVSAEMLEARS